MCLFLRRKRKKTRKNICFQYVLFEKLFWMSKCLKMWHLSALIIPTPISIEIRPQVNALWVLVTIFLCSLPSSFFIPLCNFVLLKRPWDDLAFTDKYPKGKSLPCLVYLLSSKCFFSSLVYHAPLRPLSRNLANTSFHSASLSLSISVLYSTFQMAILPSSRAEPLRT